MTNKRKKKPSRPVGRPAIKKKQIAADIRRRIVSGAMPASGRLATRRELCRQYNVSTVTVQQALDQLMAEGFVVSRGMLGTFVADNPPHLSRYAVVCSKQPGDQDYPRFWTAIESEIELLRQSENLDLHLLKGVEPHIDNDAFQKLLSDIKHHCLAGIIFLHPPFEYANTPLVEEPGIARAAIMLPTQKLSAIQSVMPNCESFHQRALDYLASRGRRRVAVLAHPYLPGASTIWLEEQIAARQMHTEPYWIQFSLVGEDVLTRRLTHLLMHADQGVRPDCLIIADDNLVEAATAGLVLAGVRVPKDLEIVAHCNYPLPTSNVIPAKRLGFSARQIIQECVNSIDAQRRGEGIKPPISVPAVFEDELSPNHDLPSPALS